MRARRTRLAFRIDPLQAEEVVRLAGLRRRDVSDTIAYLVARGLEREARTETEQIMGAVTSCAELIEQLLELTEVLEQRESERFRRVLGHLQVQQALTAEAVACQRVKMLDDRPKDYARAVDLARRQATEDAGMFRESLSVGGPPRRSEAVARGGRAA
jgi:hypothetical protein